MKENTLTTRDVILTNLKAIMDDRGLSYKDLGDIMGLSKQRVSGIFNNPEMTLKTIGKIAAALDIEETDLTSEPKLLSIKKQLK